MPAARGPQATVGPQFWFQVKEEERIGLMAAVRIGRRRRRRGRVRMVR
jgi:hypothetical protein